MKKLCDTSPVEIGIKKQSEKPHKGINRMLLIESVVVALVFIGITIFFCLASCDVKPPF